MGAKRRNYDNEFKQAAIRLVTINGHGVGETARNLGINANMLSRWKREEEVKQYAISTGNGLASEEQQELRQLRNEVKRLRMEREILKNGFVAGPSVICDGRNSSASAIIASLGGATEGLLVAMTPLKNMVQGVMRI